MKKERVVISLGGSLLVPGGIDIWYIQQITELIASLKKQCIVVVGGGTICRSYQAAATELATADAKELDWIGIMATRLNAELVRVAFGSSAHKTVLTDPTKPIAHKQVVVAAGWKPGWSTDYVAVHLAKRVKASVVVNLTAQEYVYTKNPTIYPDARPYTSLIWAEYRQLIGDWKPGMNAPFDPVAAKLAEKNKIAVVMLGGKNLNNVEDYFSGRQFKGTLIH